MQKCPSSSLLSSSSSLKVAAYLFPIIQLCCLAILLNFYANIFRTKVSNGQWQWHCGQSGCASGSTGGPLLQSYHWQLQLKHFISVNWLNLIAEKSIEIKLFWIPTSVVKFCYSDSNFNWIYLTVYLIALLWVKSMEASWLFIPNKVGYKPPFYFLPSSYLRCSKTQKWQNSPATDVWGKTQGSLPHSGPLTHFSTSHRCTDSAKKVFKPICMQLLQLGV